MSEHEAIAPAPDGGPDDPGNELSAAFAEAFGGISEPEPKPEATQDSQEPHDTHASQDSQDSQDLADDDEAPEDLHKADQRNKSTEGRLRWAKEDLERKAREYEQLQAELKAVNEERRKITDALIQARQQPQQPAQAAPAQQLPMAEIPEELKEEAENFSREYPDLVPLLRYPGREGVKLRKLLADYGPDVAAAHGNSIMAQHRLAQTEAQVRQQFQAYDQRTAQQQQELQRRLENERRQAHYQQIYQAVPDYASIATDPSRRADLEAFHARLSDWVEAKPHREAARMLDVLRQGDAPSVISVLTQFQQEQSSEQPPAAQSGRQAAARAAAAVPSRSSGPPRGRADPNDRHAAYREAFG